MQQMILRFLTPFFCLTLASIFGFMHGKVDVGPAIIDVDVLESGKTIETLHMKGVKGDASLLVYEGYCIKPGFLWGKKGHSELTTGTIAAGYYLPFRNFRFLPHVGITWSYLQTRVDIEQLMLHNLKERFRSSSPFIGMEICYLLSDKWTITALYQYAWSRTDTKIGSIVSDKSHSCGPNYGLGVEYSLNKNWSIVFGVGYNITLSKEKHGLRGKGAKLSVAYYF